MESTITNEKNNNFLCFPKLMENGDHVFLMPNPKEGIIVARILGNNRSALEIGDHVTELTPSDFEDFHGTINGLRNR